MILVTLRNQQSNSPLFSWLGWGLVSQWSEEKISETTLFLMIKIFVLGIAGMEIIKYVFPIMFMDFTRYQSLRYKKSVLAITGSKSCDSSFYHLDLKIVLKHFSLKLLTKPL